MMNYKHYSLLLVTLIGIFFILSLDPIPQSLSYHCFADQTPLLIPHFLNVISNLPFLFVGIYAFYHFLKYFESSSQLLINLFLATGITLTAFGSAYYHWHPNNQTLLWDRLPMTLIFMSFFSSVLARYISTKFYSIGIKFFIPLGLVSVIYWYLTEWFEAGDLRLYILIQFLPIILIPMIMILFKRKELPIENMLWIIYLYMEAKAFELFDHETLVLFDIVSGHTLKHIFAAGACYFMVRREINILKKTKLETHLFD